VSATAPLDLRVRAWLRIASWLRAVGYYPTMAGIGQVPLAKRKATKPPRWMHGRLPRAVDIQDVPEPRVRVYRPLGQSRTLPTVVFAHGGGFVNCGLDSMHHFCAHLACAADVEVVSVDYPLAPESPFPAALEFYYDAICRLAERCTEVTVMGDSAGANLAAAACLLARRQGGPRISRQVLVYPTLDATLSTPRLLDETPARRAECAAFYAHYVGDHSRTDELVGSEDADVERLRELVVTNECNPTWELFWGSPGTMVAAREAGLDAERERSAELLLEQWGDDGLWTQDIAGRPRQMLGPAHGFAGNVHALRGLVDDDDLRRRIEPPLRRYAVADGGLVNWPPRVGDDCTRTQWCHGAPGIVITLGDLMPRDLLLGGAELTWHAGPLVKGPGLCHGTAGNGYAFLRVYALTGDELWLDRARRFAMHALEQVDRARFQHGRGRFSLFTGDVGAALFARACVDGDPRFPTMDVW
jgi:acetyl esterase/lipase